MACETGNGHKTPTAEVFDSSTSDTADVVDNGEYLYTTVCLRCHGGNSIDILELAENMTDEEIENIIVNGSGIMPPQNELTLSDVTDVVVYIRSQLSID